MRWLTLVALVLVGCGDGGPWCAERHNPAGEVIAGGPGWACDGELGHIARSPMDRSSEWLVGCFPPEATAVRSPDGRITVKNPETGRDMMADCYRDPAQRAWSCDHVVSEYLCSEPTPDCPPGWGLTCLYIYP